MVGALIIKSENTAGVVKCVNTVYRNYVVTIINFAEKRGDLQKCFYCT
jgi:hypothetical protein